MSRRTTRNGNDVRTESHIKVEETCAESTSASDHGYHQGCHCSVCVGRQEEKKMLQELNDKLVRILKDRDDRFRELCLKYKALKEYRERSRYINNFVSQYLHTILIAVNSHMRNMRRSSRNGKRSVMEKEKN